MRVRAERHGEGASKAKVGELQGAFLRVHEHVLRLEIPAKMQQAARASAPCPRCEAARLLAGAGGRASAPVEDAVRMAPAQAGEHLVGERLRDGGAEGWASEAGAAGASSSQRRKRGGRAP